MTGTQYFVAADEEFVVTVAAAAADVVVGHQKIIEGQLKRHWVDDYCGAERGL